MIKFITWISIPLLLITGIVAVIRCIWFFTGCMIWDLSKEWSDEWLLKLHGSGHKDFKKAIDKMKEQ